MGRRKKKRTHVRVVTEEKLPPRTFVIARGKTSKLCRQLVHDFRRVLKPNTAVGLKEKKSNKLKDFLHVAGPLQVSHLISFSQSEISTHMRIMKLPRGPTVSFRIEEYALMNDIKMMFKRPLEAPKCERTSPILVLNNFPKNENHTKLTSLLWKNMFPPVDPSTIKLAYCRRIVLINYGPEEGAVEFRHYYIKASPVGLNRRVKKIVKSKIPDLSKYKDISEYVLQQGAITSDSELEDTEANRIRLPQMFPGRGNHAKMKSAIRLREIGPRLSMKLFKIEEGLATGKVLYHAFEKRSLGQEKKQDKIRHKAEMLRIKRKREQEANVKRKGDERAAKKAKKLERRMEREQEIEQEREFLESDIEAEPSSD